jgi:ABC-type polysaccharide/polyol phosphate transport system ATPase subunit
MARIFMPTRGEVVLHGRVAPMIELGVGFHPDLTGYENIYLNTSLFSLSKRETDGIYREIVEFSELEQFIDVPVKNYSTGMYARLGFAIAVHLVPEILLIDEVLSVGDEHFQQKCLRRMAELRSRGTTIVLVSHSMDAIERLCDRACLLLHGRLAAEGKPAGVIEEYRAALQLPQPAAV